MRLRILDIDGSVVAQPSMARAVAAGHAQYVDLRDEERALRLWASHRRLARIGARLVALPAPDGSGPMVTFFGSGDYHHLTTMLVAGIAEPFTIVHFDNHPDWVRVPPTHNCGGWVNRALALPQVQRVVTLGVCSDDLVTPQLKTGNVPALSSGRLELHPWRAAPSRVWGRVRDGHGHRQAGHFLEWACLGDKDFAAFAGELAGRLPTDAVWVTIDKDVLRAADAATNWDQGQMPLQAMLSALEKLAAKRRILGVDICGEYSPPRFDDPVKRVAAWLDHPGEEPSTDQAVALNDRTNALIVDTLARILP